MVRMLKYPLEGLLTAGECEVMMPASAKIKTIQIQHSMFGSGLMAWAEVVNPDGFLEKRRFVAIPTGAEVPDFGKYMLTFQHHTGIVSHVYQLPVVLDDVVEPQVNERLDRD